MKINLKATGIELTPAISSYAEKKISSLEKFFRTAPEAVAHVEVGKVSQHHKSGDVFRAEVRVIGAGLDFYAAAEKSDLYAAIDAVKDEAAQALKHEKGRRDALYRRGGRAVKDMMKGLNFFKKRS
jgi:putative sigma-54 modulation protein